MSEIKTIMEYFVRRVFGNANNLPADAASGTLLDHLLRIKDNIKVAYDWLHQRLDKDFLPTTTLQTENTDNLLSNLQKLDNRKISNDSLNDGIDDGVSLVRLLCSDAGSSVTELKDDNEGWGVLRYVNILSLFPNIKRLQISCTEINQRMYDMPTIESLSMPYLERTTDYKGIFYNSFVEGTELDFPSLDYVSFGSNFTPCIQNCNMRVFKADKLRIVRSNGTNSPCFYDCKYLEEILMPSLEYCNHYGITTQGGGLANKCPNLWKVVVGDLSDTSIATYGGSSANGMGFVDCPNLIHLELGANGKPVQASVDARWWNPTSVLSDSERLPIFLSNFQTYIADRVVDRTGKTALTLTLSDAVYEALQAQEGQTILATLTNKNWNVAQA